MKLRLDFETYSDLDINDVTTYQYASHPSTRILMLGYKQHQQPTQVWEPGEPIPEDIYLADQFYAHNAVFEYLIFKYCGPAVGLPVIPLNKFIDVMALCGKYSFPLGLGKAADALRCDIKKNPEGLKLIKMFCGPTGYNKQNSPSEWQRFKQYCADDVDAMENIICTLPSHKLSSADQRLWELTQEINLRGIPVDVEEAEAVYRYVETYKECHAERLPDLTGGMVTKPTQVQRIKDWCAKEGYPMPDGLGAQLIEEALEGPNPPPTHVAQVLEIRKEMGSSSANKFKLASQYAKDGRVHMCFIKNGAISTNRYASWNFQMHNLSRMAPLEDPDVLFQKFKDIEEIERPFLAAKSLVRAMIKAPEGKKFCVADWSGIETCLLFWFVNDQEVIDILMNHGDLYRVMAGEVYNVKPEAVCKETQRPLGKALILGCGYGMGFKRFKEAAKSFGVTVDLPTANLAVNKYRQKFPKVQQSWFQLSTAARKAMNNPNKEMPCLRVFYMFDGTHLWLTLPSGRKICYPFAHFKEGDIQYYGISSLTKQWTTQRLTPSINIENIIQGAAVDILEHSVIGIEEQLPRHEHIGHIHDENITLVDEDHDTALTELIDVMVQLPDWAKGLPLFAEGYLSKRFKK